VKIQDGVCNVKFVVSNHWVRGVLISFASLAVLACSKTDRSNTISQPSANLQTPVAQSIQKEAEQALVTESKTEISEGLYWLGGTDQGLEVQGDLYRYYSEGGEQRWRSISELKAIKPGVIFDGQSYWCLSTLAPATGATACSENGWIERQSGKSEQQSAEFRFFLSRDLAQQAEQGRDSEILQQEPRIINLIRTPCGAGAVARVTTMPSLEEDNLMPEKVVEIDAQNKTLRRWSKPIDAIVLARR
jgi:hypothetical protein